MLPTRRITTSGGDVFRDEFSLAFDGSNDYVDCGAFNNLIAHTSTTATLGVWMKSADDGTGSDSSACFVGERTGFNAMLCKDDGSNTCAFKYTEVNAGIQNLCQSTTEVFDQQWHFIVGTYNSGVAKIYVDGVLEDTQDNSGTDTQLKCDVASLGIGGESATARRFYGNISEVVIYDKALSASEVKTLYNGREPYNYKEGICLSNLKAWWRMGDGLENHSGTTIYDMSDNTNNGTMTNMDAEDFKGDTP